MKISFHPLGNEAMLINFEQKIDESINEQVHILSKSIELLDFHFVKYTIPAYCSLTIVYDRSKINFEALKQRIKKIANGQGSISNLISRKLYIPVCYDRSFALDLDEIANQTGLLASEIIKKHTSTTFKTYMIGFTPGFPYLGKLPKDMECVRKPNPRLGVPQGAVGLAGLQTGIYPKTSPGGWQIIGNTPVNLSSTNEDMPFLFQVGDEVRFYSISKNKYWLIYKAQKVGKFNWSNVYE